MHLKSLWIALVVLCWTATSHADIVYDNIGSPSNPNSPQVIGSLNSSDFPFVVEEWGDEVFLLTPGPRAFESAAIAYSGSGFAGGETLTLNFYTRDGAPTPGSFGYDTPGTLLFTQTQAISNGDNQALFSDASGGVLLPDSFTVGLVFNGIGIGEDYQIPLFDPPAIGSSFADFWILSEPFLGGWSLNTSHNGIDFHPGFDSNRIFLGHPGPAPEPLVNVNFGIRISSVEAIPAPGAILLGGIGVGVVSWLRRRRTL